MERHAEETESETESLLILKGRFNYPLIKACLVYNIFHIMMAFTGLHLKHGDVSEVLEDRSFWSHGVLLSFAAMGPFYFIVYFLKDAECEIHLHNDHIEYYGFQAFGRTRSSSLRFDNVDRISVTRKELDLATGNIYEIEIGVKSSPYTFGEESNKGVTGSLSRGNTICMNSYGFSKEDFIIFCEHINERLLDGTIQKEILGILDELEVFKKSNKRLREILEKRFANKRIKCRSRKE